jgi:hypothetical protein
MRENVERGLLTEKGCSADLFIYITRHDVIYTFGDCTDTFFKSKKAAGSS